jgi:hypothetical protein
MRPIEFIQKTNWEWLKEVGPGIFLVDDSGFLWRKESESFIPKSRRILYKLKIKQKA